MRSVFPRGLPAWIVWSVVSIAFISLVAVTNYTFRDPDSRLYADIGRRLADEPLREWIAPHWFGFWERNELFREHPPGAFWVNAALTRAGAPAGQAAAIANFFYYLITFFFVYRIGTHVRDATVGWAMVWAAFLTPVTQQYLIRGNLEPPLTMALVAGMYCLLRADTSVGARFGLAAALVVAVFAKGMQGIFVGIVAALYWLAWSRDRGRLLGLALAGVMLAVTVGLFELAYYDRTGDGFWLRNVAIQAGIAVNSYSPFEKLYNLVWYLGRLLYYALPWSALLLFGLAYRRVDGCPREPAWRWLVASAAALVLIMSLFERRADRYIFPAYTLVAMAGGWYAVDRYARVRRWLSSDGSRQQLLFGAALLLSAILKVIANEHFYRNIQFWRR